MRLKSSWCDLEGKGYGISLLVHACLLLVLSLLVINHYRNKEEDSPLLVGQTEEVVPIEEIDTRVDFLEGAETELALTEPILETTEESEILVPDLVTDTFIQPESHGDSEGVSLDDLPFAMPVQGKVVTQGISVPGQFPKIPNPSRVI
ncbi:MAG: hypothetical protein R3C11_19480 [Planctomycetaceae bacterium]